MDLIERKAHFEFGENWKSYARKIDQSRIDSAVEGLQKLFPEGLAGKSFLDIGCGSGLHSLAALKLGAASVLAIDLDENSVETTKRLLSEFSPHSNWRAAVVSIFDATPQDLGTFDVVYSWGVLHHTGDMWRAIERASALVRPGGLFAIAIYAATAFDAMWTAEKRFYARAPRPVQCTMVDQTSLHGGAACADGFSWAESGFLRPKLLAVAGNALLSRRS